MMKLHTLLVLLATATGGLAWADDSNDGLAQEDDSSTDDELGDILGGSTGDGEGTPSDETRDFERSSSDPGADDVILVENDSGKKRLIKTIQKKNFFKKGRWEASPHFAFVANDPFLNRYIVGAGINYNLTEIFAIEANFDFSPDLGDADWKPVTKQLIEENNVSPDISKLTVFGSATFLFSPIYGKVAVVGREIINFDLFGAFGMGMVRTGESLEALDAEQNNERAVLTQYQMHPTTNFGGGARIIFGENLALRVDGRSMVYIETVNATQLEMKNNFLLQGSMSVFFPRIK
ncbi:MAG: outer membrane beta-barrel domain-containing protein [Myxococcota bacterium]|nr:outer membrane beta-barrel domain-containing protein [Myxococcota bacterium]